MGWNNELYHLGIWEGHGKWSWSKELCSQPVHPHHLVGHQDHCATSGHMLHEKFMIQFLFRNPKLDSTTFFPEFQITWAKDSAPEDVCHSCICMINISTFFPEIGSELNICNSLWRKIYEEVALGRYIKEPIFVSLKRCLQSLYLCISPVIMKIKDYVCVISLTCDINIYVNILFNILFLSLCIFSWNSKFLDVSFFGGGKLFYPSLWSSLLLEMNIMLSYSLVSVNMNTLDFIRYWVVFFVAKVESPHCFEV